MEIKEAINWFKTKLAVNASIGFTGDQNETAHMAIAALEKQIPEKPREHYNWCDFSEDEKRENSQWLCHKCGWAVDESWVYCTNCGQKIGWFERSEKR